ncbi:isoprenoid synthase domain-containing protein [Mycena albidolilacea]|uniref:Terpene synthase n=1 Tax=Mycena albidolilacea TaxID=1033008 RepID=A0AAD6ZY49_9AGAR|nr:isoprenoid synthase domain-containing protein [Mycena albidolilacea]
MPLQDLRTGLFRLPALQHAVSSFELKISPYYHEAERQAHAWFDSYEVYTGLKRENYLSHRYPDFAARVYPEAHTQAHLETCMALMLWYDDLSDESGLKHNVEGLELAANISIQALRDPDGPAPTLRFARMLQDFFRKMRATGSAGCCRRLVQGFEDFARGSLRQTALRIEGKTASIEEFVRIRRDSVAVKLMFAFMEYAMDLQIPDEVFNDESIASAVEAAGDVVGWNNDICSFNNEQSHEDNQNIVYCTLVEKNCTLQEAMDFVAGMMQDRIKDYLALREARPSFHLLDVRKYFKGLEYCISGSLHWYYHSKRAHCPFLQCARPLILFIRI